MTGLETGLCCLVISLFWGATNPLIKKSTKSITSIKTNNKVLDFINEITYLIKNWKYLLLLLLNQVGSLLYFLLLQSLDLSLIVPTVNALTFVITAFVGTLLGDKPPSLKSSFGLLLIIVGITLCVLDKVYTTLV